MKYWIIYAQGSSFSDTPLAAKAFRTELEALEFVKQNGWMPGVDCLAFHGKRLTLKVEFADVLEDEDES